MSLSLLDRAAVIFGVRSPDTANWPIALKETNQEDEDEDDEPYEDEDAYGEEDDDDEDEDTDKNEEE